MKVEQFEHANQFHIWHYTDTLKEDELQSYQSLVVSITTIKENDKMIITLGRHWDYSTTTAKHVYDFLEIYGRVNFYGVSNKRQYVNKLLDKMIIDDKTIIKYDENMR